MDGGDVQPDMFPHLENLEILLWKPQVTFLDLLPVLRALPKVSDSIRSLDEPNGCNVCIYECSNRLHVSGERSKRSTAQITITNGRVLKV